MIVTFSDVNFLISLVAWTSSRWKLVVRVRTCRCVVILILSVRILMMILIIIRIIEA